MNRYITIKQLFSMVVSHFYVCVVLSAMGIIMTPFLLEGVTKYIFSGISVLVYMLVIYNKSNSIAHDDKKSYTLQKPYICKGIVLPAGIFIIWLIVYILFKVSWKYNIIAYSAGMTNNAFFVIWNFMYNGFMNLDNGKFTVFSLVLMFVIPLVASGLGYFAGYKEFDLSEKVANVVYEKTEEKDDEEG